MISRVHAKILQLPDTNQDGMHMWKIVDNKSVNGIFVNSVKVAEAILQYVATEHTHAHPHNARTRIHTQPLPLLSLSHSLPVPVMATLLLLAVAE